MASRVYMFFNVQFIDDFHQMEPDHLDKRSHVYTNWACTIVLGILLAQARPTMPCIRLVIVIQCVHKKKSSPCSAFCRFPIRKSWAGPGNEANATRFLFHAWWGICIIWADVEDKAKGLKSKKYTVCWITRQFTDSAIIAAIKLLVPADCWLSHRRLRNGAPVVYPCGTNTVRHLRLLRLHVHSLSMI